MEEMGISWIFLNFARFVNNEFLFFVTIIFIFIFIFSFLRLV